MATTTGLKWYDAVTRLVTPSCSFEVQQCLRVPALTMTSDCIDSDASLHTSW